MNKLLEVYSKGFFNALKEGEIEMVVHAAQEIIDGHSQTDLQNF
jgi:hypothetical protein